MLTNSKRMKVSLHGMEDRTIKTMALFLEGPCQGVAELVCSSAAEVDIFDFDVIASKRLLNKHLDDGLLKPVIVLSVEEYHHEGTIHVRKPVSADDLINALEDAKKIAAKVSIVTSGYGAALTRMDAEMNVNPSVSIPLNEDPGGKTHFDAENQLKQLSDWFDNDLSGD